MAPRTEQRPSRAAKATKAPAKATRPRAKATGPNVSTAVAATRTTARRTTTTASRRGSQSDSERPTTRSRRPSADAVQAAEQTIRRDAVRIHLPVVGEFRLPAADELTFLGGLAALTALGLVEWPVALVLGAAHELSASKHHSLLRNFGEALEAA